jgi:hypothetical protein
VDYFSSNLRRQQRLRTRQQDVYFIDYLLNFVTNLFESSPFCLLYIQFNFFSSETDRIKKSSTKTKTEKKLLNDFRLRLSFENDTFSVMNLLSANLNFHFSLFK